MNSLKDLRKFGDMLSTQGSRTPALFVGHGSPMNGIEDNTFSQSWQQMGRHLPTPTAVLVVSAHWFTKGTFVTAMDRPQTIHDFGGFPKALFDVQYPAPGDHKLAAETAAIVKSAHVGLDHEWGLDHGAWTVVRHMYPKADIPVLQLSIDYTKGPQFHYELAKELAQLRNKGVLIMGSGNMVHNLRMVNWNFPESGYAWADEMNDTFKSLITRRDHPTLIQFDKLGQSGMLSIPTPEHYLPLLYTLGLQDKDESAIIFNDKTVMGSISMTSVLVG